MGKSNNAPAIPDPAQTASSQTGSNIQTATAQSQLNNVNQNTPFGSINYTQTPGVNGIPQWTQNTTLTPQQQAILTTQQQGQQHLANNATAVAGNLWPQINKPINAPTYQNYGAGPTLNTAGGVIKPLNTTGGTIKPIQMSLGPKDFSADRQRVENALMGRLNTQTDKDRAAMEASLANRGIRIGSGAYGSAQDDFGRTLAENRTSAILGAGQEQNRLQGLALNAGNFANSAQQQLYGQTYANAGFGNAAQQQHYSQTLGNAGFGNTANQQMFQNANTTTAANNDIASTMFGNNLSSRNQSINQLLALMGGGQVQQPQFPGTSQTGVAGTDVAGIQANAYNAANGQYQQQQQQQQSTLGGLFTLGSSALMAFSDKRLKDNIEPTGETVAGVPVKTWNWKGSGQPDKGVVAQDLERKHPELVDHTHPSGFRRVDYGGLMRLGAAANEQMKRAA